jgi:hypothetical protein
VLNPRRVVTLLRCPAAGGAHQSVAAALCCLQTLVATLPAYRTVQAHQPSSLVLLCLHGGVGGTTASAAGRTVSLQGKAALAARRTVSLQSDAVIPSAAVGVSLLAARVPVYVVPAVVGNIIKGIWRLAGRYVDAIWRQLVFGGASSWRAALSCVWSCSAPKPCCVPACGRAPGSHQLVCDNQKQRASRHTPHAPPRHHPCLLLGCCTAGG